MGRSAPGRRAEVGRFAETKSSRAPSATLGGSDSGRSTTSPAHPSSCLSIEASRSVAGNGVELLIANASITNEWRGTRRFTRRTSLAAVDFSGTGRAGQRIETGRRLGAPWLKLCFHSSVPQSDCRCRAGHDEAEADSKTQQGHVVTGPR